MSHAEHITSCPVERWEAVFENLKVSSQLCPTLDKHVLCFCPLVLFRCLLKDHAGAGTLKSFIFDSIFKSRLWFIE
jgi:hypothetical protein